MRLGISTASFFPNLHTEESIKEIASLGIDTCEVFFETRSQYCDEYAKVLIDSINEAKKMVPNFKVHSMHSMTQQFEPDLFSMGSRARADGEKTYEEFLKVVEKAGVQFQTFHGAAMLKHGKGIVRRFDYDYLSKIINHLCDMASEHNVKLCYENVHWCYFSFPDYFKNLKLLCPRLGSVLDIKQAMQSGYDYKEYLKVMGNSLETVHLCDYNNDGATAIPGRGRFDFVELFKILLDMGFDGGVLMEVYSKDYKTSNDLLEGYNYLGECLEKAKK